jgi:hypothetical protein
MFLLPFLEEKLGAVALWPSYVLRLLFFEATSLLGVTSLAAFFHGNGIPMNAAISLHLKCHGYYDVAYITHIIQTCYDEWNGPSVLPVIIIYFNMEERLFRFVNGPVLPVLEEFSTTGFNPSILRTPDVDRKLGLARRCPYIPQALYCLLEDRCSPPARRRLFPE